MKPTPEHTVLVVAAEFPPVKTIGRIRTVKFVEQLRAHGWRAVVLTIEPRPGTEMPALRQEIPPDTPVHRVAWPDPEAALAQWVKRRLGRPTAVSVMAAGGGSGEPPAASGERKQTSLLDTLQSLYKRLLRNWIYLPDDYLPWALKARTEALRLCREQPIDLIYTTLPPFSTALIGYRLKSRTGLPWVVDYRDLWYGDVLREWIGPRRRRLELMLERRLMSKADVIIAVSEQKTDYLRRLHPRVRARWETLTNGYDPEIFAPFLAEPRRPDEFIDFVYTGRLFKNRRGYAFAEALGQLAAVDRRRIERVRVHIYGAVAPEIRTRYNEILARHDIAALFDFAGEVGYHEAMRAQVQCDYLLLIVDTGETSSGVIPGKLFEYVASRRPIFALVDTGATQTIIERGRLGWVVPAEDVERCRTVLAEVLAQPVPERLDCDAQYLSRFERRRITARLAEIFDAVISSRFCQDKTRLRS